MTKSILLVEDDRDINELIQYNLKKEGYEVRAVYDGEKALESIASFRPDLVLLDLMLPRMDGLEVCRCIKQSSLTRKLPVIFMTAKGEESDIVVGLQIGADDYVVKPFSPKVLMARVRALLRRSVSQPYDEQSGQRELGELLIDIPKRKVAYRNKTVDMTTLEFDIFEFLSRSPGRVYSREQILEKVWKDGKFIIDRAVDVHIRALRQKLGPADIYIETIRGVGYRFKDIDDT